MMLKIRVKHCARLQLTLWVVCLMLSVLALSRANAAEIDFTRYLFQFSKAAGMPDFHEESFHGIPGEARLVIVGEPLDGTISLNGTEILSLDSVDLPGSLEIPVTLLKQNSIALTLNGSPASSLSIRVKQIADVELHVQARVHFNTNVSNFAQAREFYGKLGFETVSEFPDTNTLEMAHAIGIETPTAYDGSKGAAAGGYLLHGELVGPGGFGGGIIDLIEFTHPRDEALPYAQLNHLGMASAAMNTTDIAADYQAMNRQGVEFISAPTSRSDGTRFAVFTDLDGTFYELTEVEGEAEETDTTNIVGLGQVNINVSDFERSRAWYQMLGFQMTSKLASTDSIEVARAMGFAEQFEIEGALVTHQEDASTLELVQWIQPYNPEPPYPVPVNHLGIHRMAFATSDIAADVAALKAQGVKFVSPITPCCSGPDSWGSIVAFYDPDGTVIELVEQPFMSYVFPVVNWLREQFN